MSQTPEHPRWRELRHLHVTTEELESVLPRLTEDQQQALRNRFGLAGAPFVDRKAAAAAMGKQKNDYLGLERTALKAALRELGR